MNPQPFSQKKLEEFREMYPNGLYEVTWNPDGSFHSCSSPFPIVESFLLHTIEEARRERDGEITKKIKEIQGKKQVRGGDADPWGVLEEVFEFIERSQFLEESKEEKKTTYSDCICNPRTGKHYCPVHCLDNN